jgi:hypothetical protein
MHCHLSDRTHRLDIVHVLLATAIAYIVCMEIRMGEPQSLKTDNYDATLRGPTIPKVFDRIVTRHPDMWVTAMMAVARKNGYNSLKDIRQAIERIEARAAGVEYEFPMEHESWMRVWKLGYE